ncbi:MAG: sulfatase, partial [Actinobacteria bacterium]|nr:sulfatase [Actinomycetota bacterium]
MKIWTLFPTSSKNVAPSPRAFPLLPVLAISASVLISACGGASSEPVAIRLLDQFESAVIEGGPTKPLELPSPTAWRFDGPTPATLIGKAATTFGWQAGPGVASLTVRDGRLVGRATTDFPIVHVERTSGLDDEDVLQAVEVRLRVSKGANLSMRVLGRERMITTADFREILDQARGFPWPLTTPVLPGDQLQTYILTTGVGSWQRSSPSSSIRHVLLRPTDAAGADFEIESIRLIFRKEYLAAIPSGVSWQGLSDVYRETLVTRAPERVSFTVSLPARPWLDLAVGTIEDGPVTFRVGVSVSAGSSEDGAGRVVLERTLTTSHRWEGAAVDLSGLADETISLSFSLEAESPGTIGFWGAPVIRNRGALPARVPARSGGRASDDLASLAPPQGVILILADTLRRDHLDAYGYARLTAPVLTQLATEGVLFQDCIAQAPWTKVSVPSILTSLYPSSHGISRITDTLPSSAVTLAEVYRDAGYATLSFVSNSLTGHHSNLHQGFEELHERNSLSLPDGQSASKTARGYVDRLLPWLEAHRDVPFFVFLHVLDPHTPYEPYPPHDTLWGDPAPKAEHERQWEEVYEVIEDPFMRYRWIPNRAELENAGIDPQEFVAYEIDQYDGSIRGMDAEIGRLLERLRQLGLADRTLLAVVSDHGEEFLEHGELRHGKTVYGEMTNIPLILWGPGRVPAGAVIA